MPRNKSVVPDPSHPIDPKARATRRLQINETAEHKNGKLEPAGPRPAEEADDNPNIGG